MSIVVGYIATDEGRSALDAAVAEARRRGVRLVVVASRKVRADVVADLDAELDVIRDHLDEADIAYEVRQVGRRNDVAEDLIAIANEVQADLIVIGLRKRSPVGKLFLGSNAQRILLESHCPVLSVKPDGLY